MFSTRRRKSSMLVDRHKMAINSEAGVMSKPDCRATPFVSGPKPVTTFRNERSFTSNTRFQTISFKANPSA
ncbi:hypothetical protein EVA_17179 [gut metagenome]|uniref:Uncharacterized protein n=1 Tax=gut metagenome TaxID=749906 RepID=J9G5C6_9ZZZZ